MIIDVHTHFIPKTFIAEARRGRAMDGVHVQRINGEEWLIHPQGYGYPLLPTFYDAEAKLAHMNALGIDLAVISIAPPLFFYWTDSQMAGDFCQMANEALARFVVEGEGRFAALATVPLQAPEQAARELERAVRELGLRGALIGTSVEGVPLDHPKLAPFFTTAERLGVPVVLHPYYVGMRPELADYYFTNLIGNPLDTTIAAARMIFSGFLDRYPHLNVVLVHAGGFLPYQVGRLDHGFQVRPETQAHIHRPPSTYLQRFYFDTITHASLPLQFLVNLVGADHVLLGTDIPFDMADTQFQDHLAPLAPEVKERIMGQNALTLFGLEGQPSSDS